MANQPAEVAQDDYMVKRELHARIDDVKRDLELEARVEHKWLVRGVYGLLTFITLCALVAAYWMLWPYKTIDKWPDPMPVVAGYQTVKQGGTVAYEYDYRKYTDVAPTISRQFVDGLTFNSSDASTHLMRGGTGRVRVAIPVPYTLPPGRYYIRVYTTFQMNPLRSITNVGKTTEFTVQPATMHPDASEDAPAD